ncbi:MAG TPA: DUF6569 family protein [Pyrinomonadaceae bacterium]|nr:DUF6569 family protein [Pyrinomonadaceae bacterium]
MKPKHLIALAVLCLLIGLPVGLFLKARAQTPAAKPPDQQAKQAQQAQQNPTAPVISDYRLSGPYTHENLTVFLVHGKDQTTKTFLTLQEALAQKKVRVYETNEVNELAIRNLSNQDVYVQAGDIVRGGDQDRMISVDFIVPPRSGRVPIAAFCVESGRWNRRGREDSSSFSSSANSVATKDLKLAAKSEKSQQAVWDNVKVAQEKLADNVVNASARPSGILNSTASYELSVEDSNVKEATAKYTNALAGIVRSKPDVIGYVFAINGEVNSADVYASRALFIKLWPKLLKSSAVEAIAELKKDIELKPVTDETIRGFLGDAEKATAETKQVTPRVKLVTREDDKNAFFETVDLQQKDGWVHRNYIRKN